MTTRGDEGRQLIVDAGLRIVEQEGLASLNAQRVAKELRRQRSGIIYHFEDRSSLLDAVIACALDTRRVRVLAALIIADHRGVSHLTVEERHGILVAAALPTSEIRQKQIRKD